MVAAHLRHDLPTRQPIADDIGAGSEAGLGELGNLCFAKALDHLRFQTLRLAIEARFDHGYERRLAGRTAPALPLRTPPR